MKERSVKQKLYALERQLLSARRRQLAQLTPEWAKRQPNKPGVYAWFDEENVVYIGESGNLSKRMGDAMRTPNHTLRRTIGTKKFMKHKGFEGATARKPFPPHIEKLLESYMRSLHVAILPVDFGRTELEEHMVDTFSPIYNKKRRRK